MRRRTFLAAIGGAPAAGALATGQVPPGGTPGPKKPYRVIDTHLHIFNTHTKLPAHFGGSVYQMAHAEATVDALRRGGVDKAFLISYTSVDIHQQMPRGVDPRSLLPLYSKDYQVATWKRYPDLFDWFPDHIDPSRPGYLDDLRRDLEAGASGIKLLPVFHGFWPDHPGFLPVYELCRKLKKPVIVDLSYWYLKFMPPEKESPRRRELVRTFADYAKLVAPIFRQFAEVPFSLAHTGTARVEADYDAIFRLIADHPNVSCDLAAATGFTGPAWLERLVRAVGAEKVMYGTDWPYWAEGPDAYTTGRARWTRIADECPFLLEGEKQAILAGNAERFLRFELPPARSELRRQGEAFRDRARALHRRSLVIAIHDHNPIGPDVPRMLAGGVTAKVYQLGVDVEINGQFAASASHREGWTRRTLAALEQAEESIRADPGHILLARTAADIERARREGKVAILLGVEGAKLLEGRLETLKTFHDRGLRELQLRWAVPNQVVENSALTDFGGQVVRECNRLGIITSLTHCPTRAFFEVAAMSEKPVIVCHSVANRTPATDGDSLSDRQLRAVARSRGVVGLHFYSSYLGPIPTVRQVADQVDYIAQVVGIDAVALGCDFFPTEGAWGDFQRAQGARQIAWAVPDLGSLIRVTEALLARGYPEDDIQKVLGGNFLRVCRDVFGG
ncbi:MAG TPA: membrane dipeptidase [Isosphaeraceae bacterium]|nr:membrane dipeptidase [Isosphaeraceae bacterium]